MPSGRAASRRDAGGRGEPARGAVGRDDVAARGSCAGSASRSPVGRTVAPRTHPSSMTGATASVASSKPRAGLDRALRRAGRRIRRAASPGRSPGTSSRSGHGSSIVVLRAWTRSPITCSNRGSSVSTPMSQDRRTARGRQAVAADLLAGERGLVDDGDVDPVPGEVIRGGRAARAGADDQDVRLDRPLRRSHAPPARPPPPAGACENFHKLSAQATQPVAESRSRAGQSVAASAGGPTTSTTAGTTRRNPSDRDGLGRTARTPRPRAASGTCRARPTSARAGRDARPAAAPPRPRSAAPASSTQSRPRSIEDRTRAGRATRPPTSVSPTRVATQMASSQPHEPARRDVGSAVGADGGDAAGRHVAEHPPEDARRPRSRATPRGRRADPGRATASAARARRIPSAACGARRPARPRPRASRRRGASPSARSSSSWNASPSGAPKRREPGRRPATDVAREGRADQQRPLDRVRTRP